MSTRKETKKLKQINVRITEKLYRALVAKDINLSDTIRKALEAELKKEDLK